MSWIAVGSTVVGLGTSLYGASQQRVANNKAQDANKAAQDQQNNSAWLNWLMTRGVAPTSPVAAGVMPTAGNFSAVNTRLPLWANINMPSAPRAEASPLVVRRKGTPV